MATCPTLNVYPLTESYDNLDKTACDLLTKGCKEKGQNSSYCNYASVAQCDKVAESMENAKKKLKQRKTTITIVGIIAAVILLIVIAAGLWVFFKGKTAAMEAKTSQLSASSFQSVQDPPSIYKEN